MELQEVLSDFMRSMGEGEARDRQAWKAAGSPPDKYPVGLLPEGLSELQNTLQRRIQVLSERVDDVRVRDGVRVLISLTTKATLARSLEECESAMTQAGGQFVALNATIGEVVRGQSRLEFFAHEGGESRTAVGSPMRSGQPSAVSE